MRLFVLLAIALQASTGVAGKLPDALQSGLEKYYLLQGKGFKTLEVLESDHKHSGLHKAQAYKLAGMIEPAETALAGLVNHQDKGVVYDAMRTLADTAYEREEWSKAESLYKKILPLSSRTDRSEISFYLIDCLIHQGRQDEGAKIAAGLPEGIWASYAYYNLGVSYIEENSDPSKSIVSFRVAEALNGKDTDESYLLNDIINYSAGYLSLNAGDAEHALTFLDKVRTKQHITPQALYIRGVALSKKSDYRSAIQSWYRVKKYPLVQSGVADAFLAMPYAYEKLGYVSKAASSLLEATSVFEKEMVTVEKIEKTVKEIGFLDAFFRHSELDNLEWFLSDSVSTNSPKVAYLNSFVETSGVYQSVNMLKEIDLLQTYLEIRSKDLSTYISGLKRFLGKKSGDVGTRAHAALGSKVSALRSKLEKLENRLQKAVADKDYEVVIAGENLRRKKQLEQASDALKRAKGSTANESIEQQYIKQKQAFDWEIKSQFDRNVRLTQSSVFDTKGLMLILDDRFQSIVSKGHRLSSEQKEVLGALTEQQSKISKALKKTKAFRSKLDKQITEMALSWFEKQKERYLVNKEKSEQALAHMYEYIALQQLENSAAKKDKEVAREK